MARIMEVCHWENPREWRGGMGIYMGTLAKELVALGHTVDFYTPRVNGTPHKEEIARGVTLIGLDVDGPEGDIRNPEHMTNFSEALERYVNSSGQRYDVVHAHYFSTHEAGRRIGSLKGIPYIIHLHQLYKPRDTYFRLAGIEAPPPINPQFFEYEITSIEGADVAILVSYSQLEDLQNFYYDGRLPEAVNKKIRVLHNGVDVRHYRPVGERRMRQLKRDGPIGDPNAYGIAFVGRLDRMKATDRIFDAIPYLDSRGIKNAHITITGEGSEAETERLEEASRHLGERVHFRGLRTGEDLLRDYQAADVCCIPTIRETFGLCVAESMACGKPVIVWKNSGGPEEIVGDAGIVVSSKEELGEALYELLTNRDRRIELGLRSRQKCVENFDIRDKVTELHNIFVELGVK